MIGGKWYSVMYPKSALLILEPSGVVPIKYIKMIDWRKQVYLSKHLWYGAAFQVNDQGRCTHLTEVEYNCQDHNHYY